MTAFEIAYLIVFSPLVLMLAALAVYAAPLLRSPGGRHEPTGRHRSDPGWWA